QPEQPRRPAVEDAAHDQRGCRRRQAGCQHRSERRQLLFAGAARVVGRVEMCLGRGRGRQLGSAVLIWQLLVGQYEFGIDGGAHQNLLAAATSRRKATASGTLGRISTTWA